MRKLCLIGIGAGDPEYITMQAVRALNAVDVFFFMDKGEAKHGLMDFRREICERYIEKKSYRIVQAEDPVRDATVVDYAARVELWHQERSLIVERMVLEELGENECGAFLVWGDPSLYDSTIRIVDAILARGNVQFEVEVIPGITSMQALAARHRIALNGIGESVVITTGRRLAQRSGGDAEKMVVMLDGQCAFNELRGEDVEVFWGAYLGMEQEVLMSGKLDDVADRIEAVRREEREKNGWIMDIYLLSRSRAGESE